MWNDRLMAERRPSDESEPDADGADDVHDVLAADEFPVGAPDPGLSPAHDVLAADEFPVGSPDPALHHGPFAPPQEVDGDDRPHDVLAADEFAVPAGPIRRDPTTGASRRRAVGVLGGAIAAGAALLPVLRRRRRRSRLDRLRRLRP
jgi:hypothetical protein